MYHYYIGRMKKSAKKQKKKKKKKEKPSVCMFVEVRSFWRGQHVRWSYFPSKGVSGGVLIMFDKRVVECVVDFIVACFFMNLEDGFQWAFVRV